MVDMIESRVKLAYLLNASLDDIDFQCKFSSESLEQNLQTIKKNPEYLNQILRVFEICQNYEYVLSTYSVVNDLSGFKRLCYNEESVPERLKFLTTPQSQVENAKIQLAFAGFHPVLCFIGENLNKRVGDGIVLSEQLGDYEKRFRWLLFVAQLLISKGEPMLGTSILCAVHFAIADCSPVKTQCSGIFSHPDVKILGIIDELLSC